MDWLVWLLFESLPALGAVLFVAIFVLLVLWRRTGRPRPLLIGLGVAIVLLVVQKLVVTQREHAIRILGTVTHDIEQRRVEALALALAPSFAADGLDRTQFLDLVRDRLQRLAIRSIDLWSLHTEAAQSDEFNAIAIYNSDVTLDGFRGNLQSTWEIHFVRTPAGWQIAGIRCRALPGLINPSLTNIRGM